MLPKMLPFTYLKPKINSFYLFGVDDRPGQFNFTSELETSNFSVCRKQRQCQDKCEGLNRGGEKNYLYENYENYVTFI